MTQKHTPTPYYAEGGTIYSADPEIFSNKIPTNVVAYTYDDLIHRDTSECKANAAFIVRACNAHDELSQRAAAYDEMVVRTSAQILAQQETIDKLAAALNLARVHVSCNVTNGDLNAVTDLRIIDAALAKARG